MNFVTHRARPSVHSRDVARAAPQDHDLPVLAKEDHPAVNLDWEPLLLSGVQPALALGAERRWSGRR